MNSKNTPELCLEAVKKNGEALRFVPEEFLSMDKTRVLSEEEILNKHSIEEMLTSNCSWLRNKALGVCNALP